MVLEWSLYGASPAKVGEQYHFTVPKSIFTSHQPGRPTHYWTSLQLGPVAHCVVTLPRSL